MESKVSVGYEYVARTNTMRPVVVSRVIDSRGCVGAYGLGYVQAIVEDPEHGRLLLSEGYDPRLMDLSDGREGYHWYAGSACRILPDESFADLADVEAMLAGNDPDRPRLSMAPDDLEALARRAGLLG